MQSDFMPFVRRTTGRACWRKIQRITTGCLAVLALLVAPRLLAGTGDYLIDVWTSENDLPDSSVTAIAQTPDGYLWIGTYNGLARFDGVRFVTFDLINTPALKHARVTGLFVDAQGTLWINTHDGSMTAWRNGVFTHEWQGGQVSAVFSR
jgi:ligand-binding sensor domain-containing protein